ncbi:MAG: MFS transporter, partial [Steroidobacteraceae bacterium]
IGRRRASLPAIALAAIATLVFLFAASPLWLFIGRTLSGIAIGVAAAAATAWAAELSTDATRASLLATTANMLGVAVGPLLAGLLAQFAPAPLATSYVVYLVVLAFTAWCVATMPETVRRPVDSWRDASFRPRVGVPAEIRAQFLAPAAAGFATFALGGYYAALVPNLLADDLGLASPAISGAIVAAVYGISAGSIPATHVLNGRRALFAGLVLLVPSAALLLLARTQASIALLLGATLFGGVAIALAYRGSLQAIQSIAPGERRAEVVASYMIACFLGNGLPVIGVAVLSRTAGSTIANAVFAAVIAALALIALTVSLRLQPTQEDPRG